MMKHRLRTLIRKYKWTEVNVPRTNLYEWDPANPYKPYGNEAYMKDIIDWCRERFDPKDYTYAMPPSTPYCQQYDNCFKRFVFRKSEDAMIFQLKWAE